ncbi:MAG: protein kinase [Thermomicrobiales bacterium]
MSVGPGAVLGSYQLLELLARGGMGEVYRARHRRLTDRVVAIKVMPTALAADPTFLQRFEREANNVAALNHPNILPLWEYGDQHGLPYIVMPLVMGGSLRDRMRGRRMAPAEVLGYLRPIAGALDYAHSRGIIHRDIKPANILLDDRGQLYVADFGIAKVMEQGAEALTRTGTGIGTPEYMAPEQTQGITDPRSDVYALGIIAYEMLTGQVPYKGQTPVDIAIKHMTAPLPPLSASGEIASPPLDAVVRKALAKNPGDRYASAGAFINDFAAIVEGATSPTVNIAAFGGPPRTPPPSFDPSRTAVLPPAPTGPTVPTGQNNQNGQVWQTGQAPPPAPARSTGRIIAITLVVVLLLGIAATVGAMTLLNGRTNSPDDNNPGNGPTSAAGATATATPPPLPYAFPIDNALLASKYAEARGQLPQEAQADARLHDLYIECFDPQSNADCTIGYRFYSRATDMQYAVGYSVFDTRPARGRIDHGERGLRAHRLPQIALGAQRHLVAAPLRELHAGPGQLPRQWFRRRPAKQCPFPESGGLRLVCHLYRPHHQ